MEPNVSAQAVRVDGRIMSTSRLFRRAVPVWFALALLAVAGLSTPRNVVTAQDTDSRLCSTHTLRGNYGLVGSGVRGLGPGASETFATISMVTYDGQGGFAAVGVSHGQVTGVREGLAVTGSYFVNPDCTGGQTTNIPGIPPLEDRFVIVDNGREVRTVVVSPATTIATASLRKK